MVKLFTTAASTLQAKTYMQQFASVTETSCTVCATADISVYLSKLAGCCYDGNNFDLARVVNAAHAIDKSCYRSQSLVIVTLHQLYAASQYICTPLHLSYCTCFDSNRYAGASIMGM